jgi:hypothetical protein
LKNLVKSPPDELFAGRTGGGSGAVLLPDGCWNIRVNEPGSEAGGVDDSGFAGRFSIGAGGVNIRVNSPGSSRLLIAGDSGGGAEGCWKIRVNSPGLAGGWKGAAAASSTIAGISIVGTFSGLSVAGGGCVGRGGA